MGQDWPRWPARLLDVAASDPLWVIDYETGERYPVVMWRGAIRSDGLVNEWVDERPVPLALTHSRL